jgi:hypothetical protein
MKTQFLALALLSATCAFGAYTYEFPLFPAYDNPSTFSSTSWTSNGTVPSWPYPTYTGSFSSAGSLIWVPTVSGTNSNDYGVNTTFTLASGGGTFINYLRANSSALASSASCTGSYVSVEIAVPSTYTSGPAAAQLNVNQCSGGSLTSLGSQSRSVLSGSTLRTVVWGTTLWVFLDNQQIWTGSVSASTGQPGFGGYGMTSSAGGFTQVLIGHHDVTAPSSLIATGLRSSILPTQVSLAWQGAADDANGIGVAGYNVSRNGSALGFYPGAELGDSTVSAGTSYTYAVTAVDFHGNSGSSTSWTVTTPPATAVDPRRVGLYTTGSYWGAAASKSTRLAGI